MLKGFYITLLVGPAVPAPAPQAVVDAITSVQVTNDETRTGFQVTFAVSKNSPLTQTLLPAGFFDPIITRVILVATVAGVPTVLSDGMITRQEISPSSQPGQSTLTITGEDLSVLMDIVEMPFMRYPTSDPLAIVNLALAKYAAFGIVPLVIPPIFPDFTPVTEKIPSQTGTDLAYIRLLAQRNGYVFYVEPGPVPGANLAYWGPSIRIPLPQPALNVNLDAATNVESLSFTLDGLVKKIFILNILDPVTKKITIPIPLPNINVLHPPLGARLTPPAKVEFPEGMAKLSPTQALAHALGISISAADAITGSGSLNVLRYGRILRARQLVGVRGAGLAYDGFYYVKSVTHNLKRGEYKQSFALSRDGLISLTPKVVP
jgi:hypothetical protein